MTHLVTLRSFIWRKKIDNILYKLIPRWWIPLYTMVTFSRIPYHQCMALRKRQDRILEMIRDVSYTVVGLFVIRRYAWPAVKPFMIRFIVDELLPRLGVNKAY